jgi:hypothetical protein
LIRATGVRRDGGAIGALVMVDNPLLAQHPLEHV